MTLVREYFEQGMGEGFSGLMTLSAETPTPGLAYDFDVSLVWDPPRMAKWVIAFAPGELDAVSLFKLILTIPLIHDGEPRNADGSKIALSGGAVLSQAIGGSIMRSQPFIYTRKVFYYVDKPLENAQIDELLVMGDKAGLFVEVRDTNWAKKQRETEVPLAFISHDSSDKDDFVRDLAHEMRRLSCPVWYDEFNLRVGDSLREQIERGLKEAAKCVLVLSPSYFANKGWAKTEFTSIFTREIIEQKNVILPVWHNVTKADVYAFCAMLPERVGLNSNKGVKEIARLLVEQIKQV